VAIWQVWAGGLAAVLILMTLTWAVSVVRHDVSLVDRVWGLAFVVLAVVYAVLGDGAGPGPRSSWSS
jgi:steroid 5-alpha reductase family enzyme